MTAAIPRLEPRSQNKMPLLPPPIHLNAFPTFEDAFDALNSFTRTQGYALVRYKPSNYRRGAPCHWDLVCARGGRKYESASRGLRKTRTRKTECSFRLKVVQYATEADCWRVTVMCDRHNHEPSQPEAFSDSRDYIAQAGSTSRNAGITDQCRRVRDPRVMARRARPVAASAVGTQSPTPSPSQRPRQPCQQTLVTSTDMSAIMAMLEAICSHLGIAPATQNTSLPLPSPTPRVETTVTQTPTQPALYGQSKTSKRSEAATGAMRRRPSSFEALELRPELVGGAQRGQPVLTPGASTPLSTALPSTQGGFQVAPALQPNNMQPRDCPEGSPRQRRGIGPLQPYEQVWQA